MAAGRSLALRQPRDHGFVIGCGDAMGDKPERQRIAQADARAGQGQIQPDLARAAGQKITRADIGDKADAGFRHGKGKIGVGQPIAPMHRNARRRRPSPRHG